MAPETVAVPLHDRVAINDDEATGPSWPRGSQRHPESAVNLVERGTRPLALERLSAQICGRRARFSAMISEREKKMALRVPTLSVTRKMSRRNMAAEFALPVPRSQAPPPGTSSRLVLNSKRLILLRDGY